MLTRRVTTAGILRMQVTIVGRPFCLGISQPDFGFRAQATYICVCTNHPSLASASQSLGRAAIALRYAFSASTTSPYTDIVVIIIQIIVIVIIIVVIIIIIIIIIVIIIIVIIIIYSFQRTWDSRASP